MQYYFVIYYARYSSKIQRGLQNYSSSQKVFTHPPSSHRLLINILNTQLVKNSLRSLTLDLCRTRLFVLEIEHSLCVLGMIISFCKAEECSSFIFLYSSFFQDVQFFTSMSSNVFFVSFKVQGATVLFFLCKYKSSFTFLFLYGSRHNVNIINRMSCTNRKWFIVNFTCHIISLYQTAKKYIPSLTSKYRVDR